MVGSAVRQLDTPTVADLYNITQFAPLTSRARTGSQANASTALQKRERRVSGQRAQSRDGLRGCSSRHPENVLLLLLFTTSSIRHMCALSLYSLRGTESHIPKTMQCFTRTLMISKGPQCKLTQLSQGGKKLSTHSDMDHIITAMLVTFVNYYFWKNEPE